MRYISTKTYGHEIGLSCCFRNHRADSHCRHLHGYALSVHFEFGADELDVRGFVVDFGSLKSLKAALQDTFDHTLIVAQDDPLLPKFEELVALDACTIRVVPDVGCEAFAEMIYGATAVWLKDNGYSPRVILLSVTVREHGANSASFRDV